MSKEKVILLVVEDSDADFRLVTEHLKDCAQLSFEVSRAKLISEAINVMAEKQFDAALLDLSLPDSTGLLNVDKICKHNPKIAVVVLTGVDDEELGMEAVKRGAQDYVIKGSMLDGAFYRSIRYAIERKRAQEALQQSRERLDLALISSRMATFDLDIIKNKRTWSEGVHSLLGTKSETFKGTAEEFFQTIHPEDRGTVQAALSKAFETGIYETEYRAVWPDRSIHHISARGKVHYNSAGQAVLLTGVCWDNTEHKEAENILKRDEETLRKLVNQQANDILVAQAELEQAKRLSDIGTLAAVVAHELRNPLAAIAITVANIQRKLKDDAKCGHHFQAIKKKIEESNQIINNLLFYSRLRKPNLQNVEIYSILKECVDLETKKSNGKIVFTKRLEPIRNILIEADGVQIREVLSNLLGNAREAMIKEQGVVEVTAGHDADSVRICIKDDGVGISKECLERIFDPFFTTKSNGTGLGLTISYQIVSMHKGSIGFTSKPGQGTVVEMILPKKVPKNG